MMEGLSGAQPERRTVMIDATYPQAYRTRPEFASGHAAERLTAAGFGDGFRSACRQAGIGDRLAHGLRQSAATRLTDAYCSEAQSRR